MGRRGLESWSRRRGKVHSGEMGEGQILNDKGESDAKS